MNLKLGSTVEARKSEHGRSPTPNHRQKHIRHESSCIHVLTFWGSTSEGFPIFYVIGMYWGPDWGPTRRASSKAPWTTIAHLRYIMPRPSSATIPVAPVSQGNRSLAWCSFPRSEYSKAGSIHTTNRICRNAPPIFLFVQVKGYVVWVCGNFAGWFLVWSPDLG